MAKTRRIICCDGTWQSQQSPHPTNVRKLAEIIASQDDHGIQQIVYYDDGVGTKKGGLATTVYNMAAAAFGWGLNKKIQDSYKRLCDDFNAGDEIYLIGFSRGAYTARSLGGLIRKCGLTLDGSQEVLESALALYRREDATPDTEDALKFRAQHSPNLTVSDQDVEWRKQNVQGFNPDAVHRLKIKFLGVMDTVGALGIPEGGKLDFLKFWNKKYRFHNTNASSMYENITHIVALNETRTTFPPTTFSNMGKLNNDAGMMSDDPRAPYTELWAPGNHGSVGGGGDILGLSNAALLLIAQDMQKLGVAFNKAALAEAETQVNVLAALDNHSDKGVLSKMGQLVLSHKDRNGPQESWEVAPATIERWKKDQAFRTTTVLNNVSDWLYHNYG